MYENLHALNRSFTTPFGSRMFLPLKVFETSKKSKLSVLDLVHSLAVNGNASHFKTPIEVQKACLTITPFSFHRILR